MKLNSKSNSSAKPASKPTTPKLTKTQRSQIMRVAALKAHTHKSFQSERTPAERKQALKNYQSALKSAPAFVRVRFAA